MFASAHECSRGAARPALHALTPLLGVHVAGAPQGRRPARTRRVALRSHRAGAITSQRGSRTSGGRPLRATPRILAGRGDARTIDGGDALRQRGGIGSTWGCRHRRRIAQLFGSPPTHGALAADARRSERERPIDCQPAPLSRRRTAYLEARSRERRRPRATVASQQPSNHPIGDLSGPTGREERISRAEARGGSPPRPQRE